MMKRFLILVLALFLITGCMSNDNPVVDKDEYNKNLISKQIINEIKLPEGYHKDRV